MLRLIVLLCFSALSAASTTLSSYQAPGIWASIEPTARIHSGRVVGIHALTERSFISVGSDKTIRFWRAPKGVPEPAGKPFRLAGGPGFVGRPVKSAYRAPYLVVITQGQVSTATNQPNRNRFYIHRITVKLGDFPTLSHEHDVGDILPAPIDFARKDDAEIISCDVAQNGAVVILFKGGGFSHFSDQLTKNPKKGRGFVGSHSIAISPEGSSMAIAGAEGLQIFRSGTDTAEKVATTEFTMVAWNDKLVAAKMVPASDGTRKVMASKLEGTSLVPLELDEAPGQRIAKGGCAIPGNGIVADSLGGKTICFAIGSRIAFKDGSTVRGIGFFDAAHSTIGWDGKNLVVRINAVGGIPQVGDNDPIPPKTTFTVNLDLLQCSETQPESISATNWGETVGAKTKTNVRRISSDAELEWNADDYRLRVVNKGTTHSKVLLRGGTDLFPETVAISPDGLIASLGADGLVRIWDSSNRAITDGDEPCIDPTWYVLATPTDPFKENDKDVVQQSTWDAFSWAVWNVPAKKTGVGNGGEAILGFLINRNNTELAEWIPLGQAFNAPKSSSVEIAEKTDTEFAPSIVAIEGTQAAGLDAQGRRKFRVDSGRSKDLKAILSSPKFRSDVKAQIVPRVNVVKDVREVAGPALVSAGEATCAFEVPSTGASVVEFQVEIGGVIGRTEKVILMADDIGDSTARPTYVVSLGINKYGDSTVSDLSFAEGDAEGIAKQFSEYEFKNVVPEGPVNSAESVKKAISAAGAMIAGKGGNLIVFISSHGYVNKEGTGFMVLPAGADGKAKLEGIKWTEILDAMSDTKADNALLIIDACYSGTAVLNAASAEGSKVDSALLDSSRVSGQLARYRQISIITSSSPGQTSQEGATPGKDGNGLFTKALLELLSGKGDGIEPDKFASNVRGEKWLSADTLLNMLRLTLPKKVEKFMAGADMNVQFKDLAARIAPVMQNPEGYIANPFFFIGKLPKSGSTFSYRFDPALRSARMGRSGYSHRPR